MNKFANSYIRGFDQRGVALGIGITNHLCRINGYGFLCTLERTFSILILNHSPY